MPVSHIGDGVAHPPDHSLEVIDPLGSGFGVGFCQASQVPYSAGWRSVRGG